MEEMIKEDTSEQPVAEENAFSQEAEDTTPEAPDNDAFIEVKFNKETKKLTLDEATTLAQKGMKLDLISEELDILRALSKEKGIGLKEFVKQLEGESKTRRINLLREKYAEDPELGELLSTLGAKGEDDEAEKLRTELPEVVIEEIPQEVKAAANLSGRGLLLEYLLYEHRQHTARESEEIRQEKTRAESLGPLSSSSQNTADSEFVKGIWGK